MHTYILIPVYNNAAVTFDCLRSLREVEGVPFSVILGDNGSSEAELRLLAEFLSAEKFPYPVTLLRSETNRGFGGINNAMVESIAEPECRLLFLNNDTVVEKNCLAGLVAAFEAEPRCGGVCPLICFHSDPGRIWYGGGRISLRKRSVFTHRQAGASRASFPEGSAETDFLTGCALMTTKRIFESLGGFDERIFLYCEDVDWSMRAAKAGLKLLVTGSAVVLHKVSCSSEKLGRKRGNFLLTSSILYCSLKNFSLSGKLLVALETLRKIAGFPFRVFTPSRYPLITSYLRGVVNGLRLYHQWRIGAPAKSQGSLQHVSIDRL